MDNRPGVREYPARSVVVAFVALAILAGPIRSLDYRVFDFPWVWPAPGGGVATAVLAGFVLLLISLLRRERMLRGKQWMALVAMLLPQCLNLVLNPSSGRAVPWLRDTPWGVAFLLSVAAPLWLGLLAALDVIPVEVPRLVVGAGIAGVGAVCLTIPTDVYRVAPNQAVALLVHLAVSVLVVFTWAYARPILAVAGTLSVAGSFLLLSSLRDAGFGLLFRQGTWTPMNWRAAALPLLVEVTVSAGLWCLWFWLLGQMALAAFSMGLLAMWTASMIPGFLAFGFMSWRIDVALVVSMAAIVVALRARVAEEQPVALGLDAS